MEFVDGPILLGEWLPDVQNLKFPNLQQARNVEPSGTVYKSFGALNDGSGKVCPGGFVRGYGQAQYFGERYYFVYTDDGIFESQIINETPATFNARSATLVATQADFLQFGNLEIAVCGSTLPTLAHTLGSATNFFTLGSSSGTAPSAERIGRINEFVVLGSTGTAPYHIIWSGIDNPLSWPTPNSATAIAQQSGEQFMPAELGAVTGFKSGDQFGLVFQDSGISRVSYVGPPVVFQFDKISSNVGCRYPRSIVPVGDLTYFIGTDGVYRTDGVTITNIGYNKVSKYMLTAIASGTENKSRVYGAVDVYKKLIYWFFCTAFDSESTPTSCIIYNYAQDRFTEATQSLECIFSTFGIESSSQTRRCFALGSNNTIGALYDSTKASGGSFIELGDTELNPGGLARLQGVKYLIDESYSTRVASVAYGNELAVFGTSTTTALVTANSATGFSDFNIEARYFRPQLTCDAVFDQLTAIEFKAKPSGSR